MKNYNDARKYNLTWESNDTTMDKQTLFNEATYNCTEVIRKIYIRSIRLDENGKIARDIDIDGASIKEQQHRAFGRCYTFLPETSIRNLGVYYIASYL